jgi:hypothetical protein
MFFLAKYNYDTINPDRNYKDTKMSGLTPAEQALLEAQERARDDILKRIQDEKTLSEARKNSNNEFIKSLGGLADSLNSGTQGMSAYNGAVSAGTKVFDTQLKSLGAFGDALGAAVGSIGIYVGLVNKQTDALAKSYQEISTVGASGKQGMQGVFDTMQQFGLGIAELPKFNALVKENSESLALFGGTVKQGLKSFANLSEGLHRTGLEAELMALGGTTESINKGLGNFLKTSTMLGSSTRLLSMTTEEQARAASEYIKQQDIVTKLTGKTAEQQQKSLEQAMSNDRYAAYRYMQERKLDELKATGQKEAADQLEAQLKKEETIRMAFEGDAQKGIQDVIANAGGQSKEGRAMQIQLKSTINSIKDVNVDAGESLAQMREGMTRFLDESAATTNQVGQMAISTGMQYNVKFARGVAPAASEKTARTEQKDQIQSTERALANYNAMLQEQVDITRKFQDTIQIGMQPVAAAMQKASSVILTMASLLPGSNGMPRNKEITPGTPNPQYYLNERETSERGNTESLQRRNKRDYVLDPRLYANTVAGKAIPAIKEKAAGIAEEVGKELNSFFGKMTDSISNIKISGTLVGDAAKSAGDAVSNSVDSVVNEFNRMKNRLNDVAPSLRTPASGQTGALPSNQVAALGGVASPTAAGKDYLNTTMTALLSEMRNLGGPKNNYNPALTNAVYTPPINRETETARSDAVDAAAQYSKEQVAAFDIMSGKLDEMIGLLSRSVGIQDKTLRAAYNA